MFADVQLKGINIELIVGIFTLIIGVFALLHSYYVTRSFANSQLIGDQLRKVLELIEYLNKTTLKATFYHFHSENGAAGNHYNNLSVSTILENPNLEPDFDDELIVFETTCNQPFRFLEFINHPLMPNPIVEELRKFHNRFCSILDKHEDIMTSQIILLESEVYYAMDEMIYSKERLKGKYLRGDALACLTWLSFKESLKSLMMVIDVWLKKQSVKELRVLNSK
jgi:hypothetical protein